MRIFEERLSYAACKTRSHGNPFHTRSHGWSHVIPLPRRNGCYTKSDSSRNYRYRSGTFQESAGFCVKRPLVFHVIEAAIYRLGRRDKFHAFSFLSKNSTTLLLQFLVARKISLRRSCYVLLPRLPHLQEIYATSNEIK